MSEQIQPTPQYPLLEAILAARGLTLKAIYTNSDAGKIFGVSIRTIRLGPGPKVGIQRPSRPRSLPFRGPGGLPRAEHA